MSKKRKVILALAALAVATPVVVAATWGGARSEGDGPALARADDEEVADGRCRFTSGQRAAYRSTSSADVDIALSSAALAALGADGSASGASSKIKQVFKGRLDLKALRPAKAGGWLVAATFTGATLAANGEVRDDVAGRLDTPFLVRMRDSCELLAFGFPRSLPDDTVRELRGALLAHGIAVVPGEDTWRAELPDHVGIASAELTRTSAGEVKLRRTHYARAHVYDGKPGAAPRVLSSAHTFALAEDGFWLERGAGEDRFELTTREATVTSTQRHEIERVALGPDPFFQHTFADIVWSDARVPPPRPSQAKPPRVDARHLSVDDVLARYAMLLGDGQPGADRRAVLLLTDALRTRPDLAFEIEKRLREGGIDAALQAPLFLALEKAGTPESHEVLRDIMSDPEHTRESRLRAVAALATAENPSEADLRALVTLADGDAEDASARQLKTSATYALGTWEERARHGGDDALAKAARETLEERLERAADVSEQAALLDAVGNSGSDELLDDIAPFLDHDEPVVKAHAIAAHRRMPLERSAPWMPSAMRAEDAPVRQAAVETYLEQLRTQDGRAPSRDVVSAAAAQLPIEPSSVTRSLLIELLGSALDANEAARAALLAHYPQEPEVRLKLKIASYFRFGELQP